MEPTLGFHRTADGRGAKSLLYADFGGSFVWWTYGESDPDLVHAMDAFYR